MSTTETKPFMKEETRFSGRYSSSVFQTLKFAYGRYFPLMVTLMVIGFVGRMCLLSNANLIGKWVDTFCQEPAVCRPTPYYLKGFTNTQFVILLALVTVSGFLLAAIFRVFFSRTSAKAVSQLYDEVTLRTSRFPIRFFDTTPVGAVVTRFSSDYGNIFRLFGGPLAEFLIIIFDLVGMIVLVTIASPWFLPIFILVGCLNYVVFRVNRDRLRAGRREMSASRAPSIAHFNETTQGAATIRVFSRQRTFTERFRFLNSKYLGARLNAFSIVVRFSMQMNLLAALLLLLTGIAGTYLVKSGAVSVGAIGVAFTFITLSATNMQMFFEWMSQLEEAMTGVERLDHYLRGSLEPGLRLPLSAKFPTAHARASERTIQQVETSKFAKGLSAEVRAENVWFRYSDDGNWILKDVSFTIRAGERVGIVGRTGSGKSSLIQALFQLYPLERGALTIDGYRPLLEADRVPNEKEVDLEAFRRSVALIAQEPVLFRGTVRENLCLGQDLPDEPLRAALRRVGLEEWLQTRSRGLEDSIEERGRDLSLGERQLLCMARCLLQNAPVIVMDEATSAVDPQSEEILVRATDEFFRERTQLIIAHRLSTLESCDRILWLKQGSVHRFDEAQVVLRELRLAKGEEMFY